MSERVVYARALRQRTERPDPNGPIYTVTTLAVIEDLTAMPGDLIEVRELGGVFGNEVMFVGGAVEYSVGAEVLVCLERGQRGLRSVAMGFSKFDVVGRTPSQPARLSRAVGGALIVGAPTTAPGAERSLDDFRELARRVTGRRSRRAAAASLLQSEPRATQSFTMLSNLRWVEADSGTPVVWYLNSSAPSPTAPSDGFADMQTALAAWTNPASASIILQFGGTTLQNMPDGQTGDADGPWIGINSTGTGLVTFEDPNDEISGSTLAIGGGYGFNGGGGTFNGTTFSRFARGYVIFQNAANLSTSFKQSLNFTRVLTHEIGHAIGLGHTQNDGTVANPTSNIMFPSCCSAATPVSPAIGADDLAGVTFIYPVSSGTTCSYAVSPTSFLAPPGGGGGFVTVTTQAGCAWTAVTNSASVATVTGGANGTGSGSAAYYVGSNPAAGQRSGTLTVAGQTVSITQPGSGPAMSLDRAVLRFGAVTNGPGFLSQTSAQVVRLTQSGAGTVTWTATSNQPWLTVSPASGSGPATITVAVTYANGLPAAGGVSGAITLTLTGAGSSVGPLTVGLNLVQNGFNAAPFGQIETPLDHESGITGSLPVTGWALDDVEVVRVRIYRDRVAGEAPGGWIPIGDAQLVDGVRPDVAAQHPTLPRFTRAGWGYLLLTNVLPNQGTGVYRLHAAALDRDGHEVLLGSRTVTCANSTATVPFGAIDTPGQGETVSGSVNNFGWVLAPGTTSRADVPGGGTVVVVIDGVVAGVPTGWTSRPDISALFPTGFSSLASTQAVHTFDSTALANGVHTIAWVVTSTNGQAAGIGSRYFTVSNGMSALTNGNLDSPLLSTGHAVAALRNDAHAAPPDLRAIRGRRGFDLARPYRQYHADAAGRFTVTSEEIDRIELILGDEGQRYSGYLRTGDDLSPLPIGSHLDPATGVFTWQPGVGYVGAYDLVFVRRTEGRAVARQDVRIVLNPKASGRVGPQVVIDTPTSQQEVGQPFVIAGWAADMDQDVDSGMAAVHVWAYPLDGSDPLFVGAAATGGARPDVAAVHGEPYHDSGYGLIVQGLAPGTYDLAVFGWSTLRHDFVPARVVRATVR